MVFGIGAQFLDLAAVFAPLGALEPVTKFFIDVNTGYPRNILGWGYVAIILIAIIASFFGLCIPGLWMIFKYQKMIDIEWPDDPDKTQRWRDKHADK